MDGTLIDSERLVIDAGMAAFRSAGLPERRDLLEALIGTVGGFEAALIARPSATTSTSPASSAGSREPTARPAPPAMPLRPGARELLSALADLAVPVALATNTTTAGALREPCRRRARRVRSRAPMSGAATGSPGRSLRPTSSWRRRAASGSTPAGASPSRIPTPAPQRPLPQA